MRVSLETVVEDFVDRLVEVIVDFGILSCAARSEESDEALESSRSRQESGRSG